MLSTWVALGRDVDPQPWQPGTTDHPLPPDSLFGSIPEERVQDADSVWRQQQAHQQHSCTLDECFQFYTKEEQVLSLPGSGLDCLAVRRGGQQWRGAGLQGSGDSRCSWPRTTRGSARTARSPSRAQ